MDWPGGIRNFEALKVISQIMGRQYIDRLLSSSAVLAVLMPVHMCHGYVDASSFTPAHTTKSWQLGFPTMSSYQ